MRAIGLLGGTFDPVHHGHLRLAVEMREQLDLVRVHLIPAREPPHRPPPQADPELRLKMLMAAAADAPGLVVDDRELRRDGPSYTVETLRSLRSELGSEPLCLLIGMDAFCALHTWHRWEELLELAHLGLAARAGATPPAGGPVAALLADRYSPEPAKVHQTSAGAIFIVDTPRLEISASRIRALVADRRSIQYLIPDGVRRVISDQGIYLHGE